MARDLSRRFFQRKLRSAHDPARESKYAGMRSAGAVIIYSAAAPWLASISFEKHENVSAIGRRILRKHSTMCVQKSNHLFKKNFFYSV